jgi:putative DNA primase/helicase
LATSTPGKKKTLGEKTKPDEAAAAIMENVHVKTTLDNHAMHIYQGGRYVPNAEGILLSILSTTLHGLNLDHINTISYKHEVLSQIRDLTRVQRSEFDREPALLNLRNGILDVTTGQLQHHDPEKLFLTQLPVDFDSNATCPKIRAFLDEVLYPEDVPLLQEIMGYCLWRDYPNAKAFVFLGNGGNGKSICIRLIRALLGGENISSRSLQELDTDRFATADLYAKLANLYGDLDTEALRHTGKFKMLTGNDSIPAQQKGRQPFIFVNFAKLIFSCNMLPEAYEDTTGFFRRFVLIVFPNTFEGTAKEDRNLLEKLTTDAELSGLLNWAIEGLRRLIKNNWRFSNGKSTTQVRDEYIRKSSPVQAFALDCLDQASNGFVAKKELYAAFVDYCIERRLPRISDQAFFKKLPQFLSVSDFRPSVGDDRPRGYSGISLRQPADWAQTRLEEPVDSLDGMAGSAVSGRPVQAVHASPYLHRCSICNQPCARGLVREKAVVYLHVECEDKWEGGL